MGRNLDAVRSFFRLELTGTDSSGQHTLACSGLELYGQVSLQWDLLEKGCRHASAQRRAEVRSSESHAKNH